MPLGKFIEQINKPLLSLVNGIKVYGIAEPIARGQEVFPGIVSNDGEIKEVTVDDIQSVIIYHKANAIGTKLSISVRGMGDQPNAFVNAYSMSMIIYLDRKKIKLRPDELFLYIQANMPYQMKQSPYSQIFTQINTVILNSQQIYDAEYKGAARQLPANHSLLQINYTIESTFHQNCFEKCPEDC